MSRMLATDLVNILKIIIDIDSDAAVYLEEGRDGDSALVNVSCSAKKNSEGQINIILSYSV